MIASTDRQWWGALRISVDLDNALNVLVLSIDHPMLHNARPKFKRPATGHSVARHVLHLTLDLVTDPMSEVQTCRIYGTHRLGLSIQSI